MNPLSSTSGVQSSFGTGALRGLFIWFLLAGQLAHVYGQPRITSVNPQTGPVGSWVSISGSNFSPNTNENIVYFGGVKAEVRAASANSLTAVVPVGAMCAPVSVTVTGLTAYSRMPYVPTFASDRVINAASFGPRIDLPINGPSDVQVADIDGDGKLDLIAVEDKSGLIWIRRNISTPGSLSADSFAPPVVYGSSSTRTGLAVGDLDGDGKLDLAIFNWNQGRIQLLRNTATPGVIDGDSFAPTWVYIQMGFQSDIIFIGDLDLDGKPDLMVSRGVCRNLTEGSNLSFGSRIVFPVGGYSVAIGDLDGDGKPELAGVELVAFVFRNLTTGAGIDDNSFAPRIDFPTAAYPRAVALGDLDGDGKLDMAVTSQGLEAVSVLRNTSSMGSITTNSFAGHVDFIAGEEANGIALGDLDGDGKVDMATANFLGGTASIFKNTAFSGTIDANSFAPAVNLPVQPYPFWLRIADLDGDGKPEVIIASYDAHIISILQNNISPPPYVTLLLQMDGADGATAFPDSGPSSHQVTAHNGVQVDTGQYKFGSASAYLDGVDDFLSIPDDSDFNFGNGDFTIDMWVKFNSISSRGLLFNHANGDGAYASLWSNAEGNWQFGLIGEFSMSAPDSVSTDVWYHVAVVRSGNAWTIYRDGVAKGSTTSSGVYPDYTGPISIGASTYNGYLPITTPLNGWIDEYRISKGIARWTNSFSPPLPISFTSPTNGAKFTAVGHINVSANIANRDGFLSDLSLYATGTQIGTNVLIHSNSNLLFGTNQYQVPWNKLTPGSYVLTGVLTDTWGASSTSAPVSIEVVAPFFLAHSGNGSVITSPVKSSYQVGESVILTATPGTNWWRFLTWSDGNTNVMRSITVGQSNSFTAVFTNTVPIVEVVAKQWDRSFGGLNDDSGVYVNQTSGGGYLIAGTTLSPVSGNKTVGTNGSYDLWVVRLDADGTKLWETNYGGTAEDYLYYADSVCETSDGGFIIGSFSASSTNGNKTAPNHGGYDYWIVRIDATGRMLWDYSFGGSGDDRLYSIKPTIDGGCILAGDSSSGADGNKTSANKGDFDFWIVRLDANGNKMWERAFGGNGYDGAKNVVQKADGTFVIGGSSSVGSTGGDKTQTGFGASGTDIWLIGLDANGNKMWDHVFGGSDSETLYTLLEAADGQLVFGGTSYSSASGTKIAPLRGLGDFWLVFADPTGGPLADYSFGGSEMDEAISLLQMPDGGVVLGGWSASPENGNRVATHFGQNDYYMVRLDASGNKLWDRSFGGTSVDDLYSIRRTSDGGFILGGASSSVANATKTAPNYGTSDYWVIKLALIENPKPAIMLTGPTNGAKFTALGVIPINAEASDLDGTITNVSFYADTNLIGIVSASPASSVTAQLTWSNVVLGAYTLTAVATDNLGVSSTSAPVSIEVVTPFFLANQGNGVVTALPAKSSFQVGELVTLSAAPRNANWTRFLRWSDGDTNAMRTITVGTSNVFTAIFTNTVELEELVFKQWEKSFGGDADDFIFSHSLIQTADGGYLAGGFSASSPGGNKSAPHRGGLYDYWIVRLDGDGNMLWDKSFGGEHEDALLSVVQTADRGFLLVGESFSGINGTKTNAPFGEADYWIIRLDESGQELWQRAYGGNDWDVLRAVQETEDGGYVLSGYSRSQPNGNKTSPHYGERDFWVVRVDVDGNLLWDRSFGGLKDDDSFHVKRTADGGFIVGGSTLSAPGGNKTSAFYGDPEIAGTEDFWVVRLDAKGNRVWENDFGGTGVEVLYALEEMADGSFVLAGRARSSMTGNMSSASHGESDIWLIRLDQSGTKITESTFGGSEPDFAHAMVQMPDGGLVLGGVSASPNLSGTKTSPVFGVFDYYIVRLDAAGNKIWDRAFGGTNYDYLHALQRTSDGGLLLGGYSESGIDGNKTSPAFGQKDFWIVKLAFREAPVGTPAILVNGQYSPSNSFVLYHTLQAEITITSTWAGATIYYSLEGEDPDFVNEYTGPFTLSSDAVIRTVAYGPDRAEADPVSVQFIPDYTLSATTPGGGTVTVNPAPPYSSNTTVSITASNLPGWTFMGWTGDVLTNNPTIELVMDANKSVQAIFGTGVSTNVQPAGAGHIVLQPHQALYPHGTNLRISGVPQTNRFFLRWSLGGLFITNSPILIAITNANTNIVANFGMLNPSNRTLTVLVNGDGTVSRSFYAPFYTNGTNVTLTATPDPGHVFSGWSGDATGAQNPLTVVMNTNKVITANFTTVEIEIAPATWTIAVGSSVQFSATLRFGDGSSRPLIGNGGTWSTKRSLSMERAAPGVAAVSNLIFAIGGQRASTMLHTNEAYDPVSNEWSIKARMPTQRGALAVAVLNNIIYAAGGCIDHECNSLTAVLEAYNSANNTWESKQPMLNGRRDFTLGVLKGKLYALGGLQQAFSNPISSVEVYDPTNNSWTALNPLPTPMVYHVARTVNDTLYVIGISWVPGPGFTDGKILEYHPATDSWNTNVAWPRPRHLPGVGVVNDIIYIVGGGGGYENQVDAYDPLRKTWFSLNPMPTGRGTIGADVLNGILYTVAGIDISGNQSAVVEAFTPPEVLWHISATNVATMSNNVAKGVSPGTTVITATAGSISGTALLTVSDLPQNLPPGVTLLGPTNGASFQAPASVFVEVSGTDSDGLVTLLEVYAGAILIGSQSAGTHQFTWGPVPPGNYALTAVATDNGGLSATSAPVNITISTSIPEVVLTSPTNQNSFNYPAIILLNAVVSDADNSVGSVDFFTGSTLITTISNAPFRTSWTNAALGEHSLYAVVHDRYGPVVTSAPPVRITVCENCTGQGFHFQYLSYEVVEGAGVVQVVVEREASGPAEVDYGTQNGTASHLRDYLISGGTLRFTNSETAKVISVPIIDNCVIEGDRSFQIKLFNQSGAFASATIMIRDDDSLASSCVEYARPDVADARSSLRMTLLPPEGAWRFPWENVWRPSGSTVAGLVSGEYPLEYKPLSGYLTPAETSASIPVNSQIARTNSYIQFGEPEFGQLTVFIEPPEVLGAARWSLAGETGSFPGSTTTNLPVGSYVVVPGQVSGWVAPSPVAVTVVQEEERLITLRYSIDEMWQGNANVPTPRVAGTYADIVANLYTDDPPPYGWNGQIVSDLGRGSGVVVKERVVLTAAHVVWDETRNAVASNLRWFFQRHAGEFEPKPLTPIGILLPTNYITIRSNFLASGGVPGSSIPESRAHDYAVLYFGQPAGRNGFNGFLVSTPGNRWLDTGQRKMLVGYPVQGANVVPGKIHGTDPAPRTFSSVDGLVYQTEELRGFPGNSGGPLYVEHPVSIYFPAGIYLGTSTDYSFVRVIDESVASLINLAGALAVSEAGTNELDPSVLQVNLVATNSGSSLRRLFVNIQPPAATNSGARWNVFDVNAGKLLSPSNQVSRDISANVFVGKPYDVIFRPAAGFITPPIYSLTPNQNYDVRITATYHVPLLSGRYDLGVDLIAPTGRVYRVEESLDLLAWREWFSVTNATRTNKILPADFFTNSIGSQKFLRVKTDQ